MKQQAGEDEQLLKRKGISQRMVRLDDEPDEAQICRAARQAQPDAPILGLVARRRSACAEVLIVDLADAALGDWDGTGAPDRAREERVARALRYGQQVCLLREAAWVGDDDFGIIPVDADRLAGTIVTVDQRVHQSLGQGEGWIVWDADALEADDQLALAMAEGELQLQVLDYSQQRPLEHFCIIKDDEVVWV